MIKSSDRDFCFGEIKRDLIVREAFEPRLWEEIRNRGRILSLSRNEYALKAGEGKQNGFFVARGLLIHLYLKENGEQVVMSFSDDRTFRFICPGSYFTGEEDSWEILAVEDSLIISLGKDDMEYLSGKYHGFSQYYRNMISDGLAKFYRFNALRLSLTSEEFLKVLIESYPGIYRSVPDKYLASFMGITREWFCKIKKKIKN
ncbi:MAG: hypothetical protein JXR86_20340 [Spirochaetales bacterium]|nr:hypothetical protein [Spirochaetales bacterium]